MFKCVCALQHCKASAMAAGEAAARRRSGGACHSANAVNFLTH